MRLLAKTSRQPSDEKIRRTIDELIDTGVPAVAAHSSGRGPTAWSALLYLAIPLVAIALLVSLRPAESSSTSTDGAAPLEASATTTAVTAKNIAFDTKRVVLEPGTNITIHFTNADSSAISHNIALYEDDTASKAIFQGKIIPGGSDTDYSFETPKSGRYYFQCDVHPGMNGIVVIN